MKRLRQHTTQSGYVNSLSCFGASSIALVSSIFTFNCKSSLNSNHKSNYLYVGVRICTDESSTSIICCGFRKTSKLNKNCWQPSFILIIQVKFQEMPYLILFLKLASEEGQFPVWENEIFYVKRSALLVQITVDVQCVYYCGYTCSNSG